MSEFSQLNQNLESVTRELQDRRMTLDDAGVFFYDVDAPYRMQQLYVRNKSIAEQMFDFERGAFLLGNPAIIIETRDADLQRAAYAYEESTGLTIVNNYPFDSDEVRPLKTEERDALRLSYATEQIISPSRRRVLTVHGLSRLTLDLTKVRDTLLSR